MHIDCDLNSRVVKRIAILLILTHSIYASYVLLYIYSHVRYGQIHCADWSEMMSLYSWDLGLPGLAIAYRTCDLHTKYTDWAGNFELFLKNEGVSYSALCEKTADLAALRIFGINLWGFLDDNWLFFMLDFITGTWISVEIGMKRVLFCTFSYFWISNDQIHNF